MLSSLLLMYNFLIYRQMPTIQQQFHPLAYSDSNGVDSYIALQYIIHNVILL